MSTVSINEFIQAPNDLPIRKQHASERKKRVITLGVDVANWTFTADYQVLVVDSIAFDRSDNPNFKNSNILGSFPKIDLVTTNAPVVTTEATGVITLTIPEDMYVGPMIPGNRTNVPVAFVGLTMVNNDDDTIETMRFPILITYEPGQEIGDPALDADYTAVGA